MLILDKKKKARSLKENIELAKKIVKDNNKSKFTRLELIDMGYSGLCQNIYKKPKVFKHIITIENKIMIMLPNFSACPKKYHAREETIIGMYRKYFVHSIAESKQYWSMCGPHIKDSVFQAGSELGQLLQEEFITEEQFFGVDIQKEIVEQNKSVKPEANWIHDDFLHAMKVAYKEGNFNPAVINADFISLKERGSSITSQIMSFLEEIDCQDVLLVSNIMLTNPHELGGTKLADIEIDGDAVVSEFERWKAFQWAWSTGNWSIHPEFYVYNGTGKQSRTIMGTFIFFRKGEVK